MCRKKKKDCYFQVEGFEHWMNQFFADPYTPNDIHVDLFETEREYILEADLPCVCQQEVSIEKTNDGLRIIVIKGKQTEGSLIREIQLPVKVMYKKMEALFDNGVVEIHISKVEEVQTNETTILFIE
ncbi:Hsp20 family protein [Bacillus sp. 165]|uniref:Hsp20/alpha crystallin family protein n=1 Tax=Bacillus sp. 165 TaxID=1529117 RepID=UPI001AD99625|nr:Hsp20 family protein [Bacillus sp. 165]MBO9129046.1 Hsp20/alpha crystallin family protein [Bacillus sp. 165]